MVMMFLWDMYEWYSLLYIRSHVVYTLWPIPTIIITLGSTLNNPKRAKISWDIQNYISCIDRKMIINYYICDSAVWCWHTPVILLTDHSVIDQQYSWAHLTSLNASGWRRWFQFFSVCLVWRLFLKMKAEQNRWFRPSSRKQSTQISLIAEKKGGGSLSSAAGAERTQAERGEVRECFNGYR